MPTFRERFTDLLLGDERRRLQESTQLLYNAYLEGPFTLPPDQLLAQLKEQDAALLTDLVHQLYWEQLGTPGYALDLTAERARAIDESRRLWKYNPLAQWMVNLWTNYGFGENIVIIPEDEDAVETWDEFWKADRNQSVLAQDKIADKLSNWLLVDGDRFLAFYASTLDGETTVRRINTKEITEVVTDPDDSSVPLFYKRQWSNARNQQMTWYYPDWEAFFRGDLEKAKLPADAIRADEQNDKTTVVILHIAHNGKDEDSLYGWPLLAAGSPWIRSQKRHLENRLAVSAAKAMYVRRATVKGGSRAVDSVIANLRSALSSTQRVETNPPAVAGSTLVENQAVTTDDLPMTTGASDAKTDGEMFAWMAGLSGGVFPHYMGLGDAYRLATATSMEKPLEMQFSRYQVFWSAQFRKTVRIVLEFKEKYGDATFQTYEAEVSTDKMVEVDLDGMSQALGRVFTTIINPQTELGTLPPEVTQGMLKASLKTILQALGVDAEAVLGDEEWEVEEEPEREEEEEVEEGGKGSGWFAPPRGTHVGGKQRVLSQVSVKSWPESQPWIQNKEAIKKGSVAGIQYDSDLRASAQYRETYIAVGDAFFREDVDSRRLTLYHEAGHSLAGPAFGEQGKFLDVIEPFRQDKYRARSVRSTYDNFAGLSSRPEEFLADVYTDLVHGGKAHYESQKYRAVYDHVAKLAKQQGLPHRSLYKLKDGKWVLVSEGELEESIALALQNYRSGLIDADDLVAFLLPTKLEEGKENEDEKGSS